MIKPNRLPTLIIRRYFNKEVDPALISTRDLYIFNELLNSSNRITHTGTKPDFYSRSITDFDSNWISRQGLSSNRILHDSKRDQNFESEISSRLKPIQDFIGPSHPLTTMEKLSIVSGLSNFELETKKYNTKHRIFIESDKLRLFGKMILQKNLLTETVFADERYLSNSIPELESDLSIFENSDIIPEFMRKNMMLNSVIPFKSASRLAKLSPETKDLSYDEIGEIGHKISNRTCVGSLHTMIGILFTKFDSTDVLEKVILPKIIHGSRGLINIATAHMKRT